MALDGAVTLFIFFLNFAAFCCLVGWFCLFSSLYRIIGTAQAVGAVPCLLSHFADFFLLLIIFSFCGNASKF